MKAPLAAIFLLGGLFFIAALADAAPVPRSGLTPEESVRRLERLWLDAYEARSADRMANILDKQFLITFENGEVVTRDEVLEQLRRSHGKPAPRFTTSCVKARSYGDTVILVGTVTTLPSSGPSKRSRYTDTYVRRPDGWRVAASHLSLLNTPDARDCPKLGF